MRTISLWRAKQQELNARAEAAAKGRMIHESKPLVMIPHPVTGQRMPAVSPQRGVSYHAPHPLSTKE